MKKPLLDMDFDGLVSLPKLDLSKLVADDGKPTTIIDVRIGGPSDFEVTAPGLAPDTFLLYDRNIFRPIETQESLKESSVGRTIDGAADQRFTVKKEDTVVVESAKNNTERIPNVTSDTVKGDTKTLADEIWSQRISMIGWNDE